MNRRLVINGEATSISFAAEATLAALVDVLEALPERVATMVNGEIVSRDRREEWVLAEGDQVELLTFAGGG